MATNAGLSPDAPRFSLRAAVWAGLALVAARSAVWLLWEQSHFDSDQAIVGLMAKHLSEGRTFPLMFYGQSYMLAVEAWLAAPLFHLFGPSVALLKLPLLAINGAIAGLLVRLLVKDAGLSPAAALVAALFFLVPPAITGSRLLEAMGGNVEPLLYALLLWITRDRGVLFGLIAGVGVMHREFTAYAVAAMVILEIASGRIVLSLSQILKRRLLSLIVMAAVMLGIHAVTPYAALLGPGSAGLSSAAIAHDAATGALARLCWTPAAILANLEWTWTMNLASLWGWRAPIPLPLRGQPLAAQGWALWPLVALFTLATVAPLRALIARRHSRDPLMQVDPAAPATSGVPGRSFPTYLIAVGLIAIGIYATAGCQVQDVMLIRYTLLAIFVPVGVSAWLLRREGSPALRRLAIACVLLWAVPGVVDNARLLDQHIRHPPGDVYRQFTTYLVQRGVQYGRAPYWTAYYVDFLSAERLKLGSTGFVRIAEYEALADEHASTAVAISDGPCTRQQEPFGPWCIDWPR